MNFSFEGAPSIDAPAGDVWTRLVDPHVIAAAGPGVERVEIVDSRHFKVLTVLRLGSFKLQFTLNVELFDLHDERELTMRATGKATGSSIEVLSQVRLEPIDQTHTRLHWQARTDIGGILARIGGQRLEGLARELTQKFWDRFAARVEATR